RLHSGFRSGRIFFHLINERGYRGLKAYLPRALSPPPARFRNHRHDVDRDHLAVSLTLEWNRGGFAPDDVPDHAVVHPEKPPNGSEPNEYWTPLIVFFQIGFPNQTPNPSMNNPRQRAARKCPSS